MKRLLTLFFMVFTAVSGFADEVTFTLDFQSPAVQKAVDSCPFARVEGDTLIFDVPETSQGAMIHVVMEEVFPGFQEAMKGRYVYTDADVTFSNIPEGKVGYHGGKFQFHMPGAKGNAWPGLLHINQKAWGNLDWTHSRSSVLYENQIHDVTLEFGIQGGNGHIAYKNIRFTRGRKGPVSVFSLKEIPQAKYSKNQPHRMRGVMSPGKPLPEEQDFADLEKWGANLIRWQMGFGQLKNVEEAREVLWSRFAQIDEVLRLAEKYHLSVVLDVHTMSGSRPIILGTPEGRDLMVEFWEEVARRYKGNPNIFGYNLMNEPVTSDIEVGGPSLNKQYYRLIKAIRAIDPET
ncbi:MAG: cellulase family glycosylhydrolase, partial [Thermoguttaceae bacterium]|nr:cellulase family glycosylhydrolase [Thermoguttaceae bacterium]